jgi:hypothetical protein
MNRVALTLLAAAVLFLALLQNAQAQNLPRTCVTINMKNGEVIDGIFIHANADSFMIADAGGVLQTIKRSDFKTFKLTQETQNKPCPTNTQRAIAPQSPAQTPAPPTQTQLPQESDNQPFVPSKRVIRWEPESTHSDSIVVDGRAVKGVTDYGLTVVAMMDDSFDQIGFLISIENKSGGRIMVDPGLYRFEATKPRPLSLSPLDPEKLSRNLEQRGSWRTVVAGMLASLARRQTATAQITDNTGYRGRVTVTEPDYEAQREVQEAARDRTLRNQSDADSVRDVSLKPNTIFNGQTMTGWVYFEKKRFDEAVLKITIGDSVYELPFKRE